MLGLDRLLKAISILDVRGVSLPSHGRGTERLFGALCRTRLAAEVQRIVELFALFSGRATHCLTTPMATSRWFTLGLRPKDPEWTQRRNSLTRAVQYSDVNDLRAHLDDARAKQELTPSLLSRVLLLCCKHDRQICAQIVLSEFEADVTHQVGRDKITPLMAVRSSGMVDVLVNNTQQERRLAALNAIDFIGRTPLMHGCLERARTQSRSEGITATLIRQGAEINKQDVSGRSALMHALIADKPMVGNTLLDHGAAHDSVDIQGRTATMTAAWRNHLGILNRLLRLGADIHVIDDRSRSVLHHLCQDVHRAKRSQTDSVHEDDSLVLQAILATNLNVNGKDQEGRTPLHLASSLNNKHLVECLLHRRASVNVVDDQERTPLHCAVANKHFDIAHLLLNRNARVDLATDQGETVLHTASAGKGTINLVRLLLHRKRLVNENTDPSQSDVLMGTYVNATTINDKTALHLAAEANNIAVVEVLLGEPSIDVALQDATGNTAMFNAARLGYKQIVEILAEFTYAALTEPALEASRGFLANIVDFAPGDAGVTITNHSRIRIHHLLTGETPITPDDVSKQDESNAEPGTFRWIHLPSNNVAWCQELLVRRFIERNGADPESFKALQMSFNHEHVGTQPHARYMRPACRLVPQSRSKGVTSRGRPSYSLHNNSSARLLSSPLDLQSPSGDDRSPGARQLRQFDSSPTPNQDRRSSGDSLGPPNHSMYLFMPFIHYERTSALRRMRKEIATALKATHQAPRVVVKDRLSRAPAPDPVPPTKRPTLKEDRQDADKKLIAAHINNSNASIHIRRTLDQSFYRTIDTTFRDKDQVILRYQRDHPPPKSRCHQDGLKLLMVDQLWMWIVSGELLITSFPQRWEQGDRDCDDLFKALLNDIRSPTHDHVSNIYELGMFVAGHCAGMSDTRSTKPGETLFIDMFDAAIGKVTDSETELFRDFESASEEASQWLKDSRKLPLSGLRSSTSKSHAAALEEDIDSDNPDEITKARDGFHLKWDPEPPFIHTLLDIKVETELTQEIKDVQDELNMLHGVFAQQEQVCNEAYERMTQASQQGKSVPWHQDGLRKVHEELTRRVQNPLKDIKRMQEHANQNYIAIKDLLDLKQKYANAMQAADVARQSQTILVFTIVTVVFLPLSFLAAFFALGIDSFPHSHKSGNVDMPLHYALKYVVGVGLGIGLPCVFVALMLRKIRWFYKDCRKRVVHWREGRKKKKKEKNRKKRAEREKQIDAYRQRRREQGATAGPRPSTAAATANGLPRPAVQATEKSQGGLSQRLRRALVGIGD